jgi:5-bromo-4-chloroindolyl phosphate hydrolysis protein
MKAKMDIYQEKMTAKHFIWSELDNIKYRVEDVLSCVNQKTDETQMDLHPVKTSLDTRIKSIQETLADTRNDLHDELGLMLQVEARDNEG